VADLTDLQAAQTVKIAGAPSSGIEDNFMEVNADGSLNIRVFDGSGNSISSTTTWLNVDVKNTVPVSQSGTWTVGISNLPTTVDTNYGAVGASTVRTASQIGNTTGGALFGAGTTTGQVLRVVLPTDQTAIPVTQSGTWSVTANAGTNLNTSLLQLDTTGAKLNLSQASTTSGQTGPLIQGSVTTAAPTYTTAQTNPLSLTTVGNLRVDGSSVTQPISVASLPLPTGASTSALQTTGNTSLSSIDGKLVDNYGVATTALRTAAQIGNTIGAADFNTGAASNQTLRVTDPAIGPVVPGTVAVNSELVGGQFNTVLPTLTNTQQSAIQLDSSGRIIVSPTVTLATGVVDKTIFTYGTSIDQIIGGVYQETSPALTAGQSGAIRLNANRNIQVADSIDISSQYRAQSVTTTAAEALGAASILVNRKMIVITPTNGTIYWGTSNAVTTSTGTPIFKNQTVSISVTDNIHIYVIAASTTDVRIMEGS